MYSSDKQDSNKVWYGWVQVVIIFDSVQSSDHICINLSDNKYQSQILKIQLPLISLLQGTRSTSLLWAMPKVKRRSPRTLRGIRWMLEFTTPKSENAPWALQLNNRSLRKEKIIIIVYYGRPTDILQHLCHDFICWADFITGIRHYQVLSNGGKMSMSW